VCLSSSKICDSILTFAAQTISFEFDKARPDEDSLGLLAASAKIAG
jgi:hypothetical protein